MNLTNRAIGAAEHRKIGRAWSIWVIDDDALVREIISAALSEELGAQKIQLLELSSYRAALDMLAQSCGSVIDLIILDNYLGDGEGIHLLPKIQEFANANSLEQIPVMMVSGNDDQSFLARCFSSGASDYVIKPFDVGLLGYKAHAMLIAKSNRDRIALQNEQLAKLIATREREEAVASFTYDYYLSQTRRVSEGVWSHIETPNAFSGDLLLSARSPSGDVFFMLVDATGHDLSAAITLIPVISGFQRMVEKGFNLSAILHQLNHRLLRDTPIDRFVAAIAIKIEPHTGLAQIWNGGMPAAWAIDNNGNVVREFSSRHMALGILDDEQFSARTEMHSLASENWFLMCSDGLLEQVNQEGASFSAARLKQCLKARPQDSIQAIIMELRRFRGEVVTGDDLSFCAIAPDMAAPIISLAAPTGEASKALLSLGGRNAFSWCCSIEGPQIAKTQLPTLCGSLLEGLNIAQDLRERVFSILSELFINAVDHGLLQLDSRLKDSPEGFYRYMELREERLKALSPLDNINISIIWSPALQPAQLSISVLDSGQGFIFTNLENPSDSWRGHGRGLNLVSNLASRLEIAPPGNRVTAIMEAAAISTQAAV